MRQTLAWLRYLRQSQPNLFATATYADGRGGVIAVTAPITVTGAVEALRRCGDEELCRRVKAGEEF